MRFRGAGNARGRSARLAKTNVVLKAGSKQAVEAALKAWRTVFLLQLRDGSLGDGPAALAMTDGAGFAPALTATAAPDAFRRHR